jgi:hypothetical protein
LETLASGRGEASGSLDGKKKQEMVSGGRKKKEK